MDSGVLQRYSSDVTVPEQTLRPGRSYTDAVTSNNPRREQDRLKSFKDWSNSSNSSLDPRELARVGFYWTGDELRCAFCGVQLEVCEEMREVDVVEEAHQYYSGQCDFLVRRKMSGNVPLSEETSKRASHSE